jgi:protocatechuate 3,4-dioxygenase beta subunit
MTRITRREFVGSLTAGAIAIPSIAPLVTARAVLTTGSSIVIPPKGEPGPVLEVTGRVLSAEGLPLEGMQLSVYHTDAEGYYSRPVSNPRQARLRGTMMTDGEGRYTFRTILPGHYPGTRNPRHIHVHLEGHGAPEHWIESYLFEDDPVLSDADARRAAAAGALMSLTRGGDGVLRASREIRLDRDLAERNRLVDGWYRNGDEP